MMMKECTPATKFQYLLSAWLDNPHVQQLISGLPPMTSKATRRPRKYSTRRFGDPHKIFRAHFRKFMELPRATPETLGPSSRRWTRTINI